MTNSFFLNKGLIGEFAKNKISALIDFLKSDKKIDEEHQLDETSSNELINIIGEPLIKDHLMDMWKSKFSIDVEYRSKEDLIREIKILRIQNRRLKK